MVLFSFSQRTADKYDRDTMLHKWTKTRELSLTKNLQGNVVTDELPNMWIFYNLRRVEDWKKNF